MYLESAENVQVTQAANHIPSNTTLTADKPVSIIGYGYSQPEHSQ